MSASNKLIQASAGVGGGGPDADFESTVLLLNADDASNGGQNNTFLDSSSNTHTITRNGNVTQGSFSPFSVDDGKWGNYFDGTGDYLDTTSSVKDLGTGDFTIDVFINPSASSSNAIVDTRQTGSNSGWLLYLSSGNATFFHDTGAGTSITLSGAVTLNTWSHIAVTRNSGTLSLYVNGTSQDSGTYTQNLSNGGNFRIGAKTKTTSSVGEFSGYMSNLRVVAGTALYTNNFTPPTTPLTDVSGTSLLTCQSNRFVDNSSNAHSITLTNTPKVVPFSPFPQTTAYNASTNGGSGYFDGSGDYLTGPSSTSFEFGTGDFTIEAWAYITSASTVNSFIDARSGLSAEPWTFLIDTNLNLLFYDGTSYTSTNAFKLNEWVHCAVSRNSGTLKIFINGVEGFSGSVTSSLNAAGSPKIGARTDAQRVFDGYMANLRVVKGTAVYTSAFTPPTAPLTAVTNTELLCNFTNASVFDSTGRNVLETVGNAQVDTTTVKYGTGAMEFDGAGDYLKLDGGELFEFGTGDFTIEMWFRTTDLTSTNMIYDNRPTSTNGNYIAWFVTSDGTLTYYVNTANRITSSAGAISTNTWYHIAISRSGTSTKMFIDGTQVGGTYTDSTDYLNGADRPLIGASGFTQGAFPFNGYIDDLRITKGIARYTASFTPPTRALPVIGEE